MMVNVYIFILSIISITNVFGRKGFGPTDQEWGYVTVRQDAHMFWWLHYTSANVTDPTEIPLVIWLQGGPGGSSTGYGNFGEIGPLDENLKLRKYSWTNISNVLFVDNPVGTGFSYVKDNSTLATNNTQIAKDFLVLLQGFFKKLPAFSKTPLYIFCESYGGKMTSEIALVLYEAQMSGKIESNLKGIGLGDSWISPVDSVLTWSNYLLNQGLVDDLGFKRIQELAEKTADAVANGEYSNATKLWSTLEDEVESVTSNVDFYNILTKIKVEDGRKSKSLFSSLNGIDEDKITEVMNKNVSKALGIDRNWVSENEDVFEALTEDFMKPVVTIVEKLLNNTDLKVVVYNGQLDLIVDTPGTIQWVNNLKWKGSKLWKTTARNTMVVNEIVEGFYKNIGKFTFYWVSRAGHMVPYDNPVAMDYILKNTINNY